jgi:SAM-dependent methyltransferase
VSAGGYPTPFYGTLENGSETSAAVVSKILVQLFQPTSVIDVGCGTGVWLRAFKLQGVKRILGVDWFAPASVPIVIAPEEFLQSDLEMPLKIDRRFDIALSLEVGEHLPDGRAESLVDDLTRLSDVVVFSAAIPLQLGFHHVNEHWPNYWKAKFENRNYTLVDRLRFHIWRFHEVEYWYAQNLLVFLNRSSAEFDNRKGAIESLPLPTGLPLVHPAIYLERSRRLKSPIMRYALRTLERFPKLWVKVSDRRRESLRNSSNGDEW